MKESAKEIKILLDKIPVLELPEALERYKSDDRKIIKQIISVYTNKHRAYLSELERTEKMRQYEKSYLSKGVTYIAGVDEVGRGPLAGPVVTAAVILPPNCPLLYINDSKKLSEAARGRLCAEIKETAICVGIGVVSSDVIDEINIRQATLLAMKKAVDELSIKPDVVLVDAETIPDIDIAQESIIKGDAKSISIAAASIVAKVTRDEMMKAYDELFPEYGFSDNKGYGSATHMEAIKKFGICPIHRKSFTTESRKTGNM